MWRSNLDYYPPPSHGDASGAHGLKNSQENILNSSTNMNYQHNVQQIWQPNPSSFLPQSHGDVLGPHGLKNSQENIPYNCTNLNYKPESGADAKVIETQPRCMQVNEPGSGSARLPPPVPSQHAKDRNPYNLEKGSLIQFGTPPCYGVIKWIGPLPEIDQLMAGVEVVCMYTCQ